MKGLAIYSLIVVGFGNLVLLGGVVAGTSQDVGSDVIGIGLYLPVLIHFVMYLKGGSCGRK